MTNSPMSAKINGLSLFEISARIWRSGWADASEYRQALNALSKASETEITLIHEYAIRRGWNNAASNLPSIASH